MSSPSIRTASSQVLEWDSFKGKLRERFGETVFKRWLEPLALKSWGQEVLLALPTRFMKDWVETHYSDKLVALFKESDEIVEHVRITVESALAPTAEAIHAQNMGQSTQSHVRTPIYEEKSIRPAGAPEREDLSSPLDPRFTFDSFVVGKPNELAYA